MLRTAPLGTCGFANPYRTSHNMPCSVAIPFLGLPQSSVCRVFPDTYEPDRTGRSLRWRELRHEQSIVQSKAPLLAVLVLQRSPSTLSVPPGLDAGLPVHPVFDASTPGSESPRLADQ